ncbi:MAG: serine/threonine protein kinase [Bdellovibrionales bacterium]|nr:serine/threonine protein kinase [Bdellovibrionales bacterium]
MQDLPQRYDSLAIGTIVFDRLEILRYLGKGTTSVVYAVRRLGFHEQPVALKLLTVQAAHDRNLIALFRNEVKVARRCKHPNIVGGLEYFKNGVFEGYTMECMEGGTLSERLDRVQRFSLDDALEMLVQIATGLEYLHQQGIVHRDLKPHNVLIALDGQAKISDFSTALWPEADLPYDIGQVGTFEYMSPEVLEAGVADHRSDVFALGIIAYQLVTGQLPYQSTQFADRLELNRRGKPTPAHRLCSDCPRTLSRLIAKAMKKKPTRRLQSAGEMLDALTALQKARGARHLW